MASAILGVGLFAANLVRLAAMAWSADAYAAVHGPLGASLFDAGQGLAVLALGNWVAKP